jgi:hypothetical protein
MNELPAAKIKMMRASTRCLTYGIIGLVPVVGLPFGLAALWIGGRVRRQEKQLWNAAKPYRVIGVACAAAGTIFWTILIIFAVFRAIMISEGLG